MSNPDRAIPFANPRIRQLGTADLPACVALAADRGWPPEENKWQLLARVSEMYGIDDPAGALAGMVVLTRHGAGLAAVGMMVVAGRYGRMGLGGRLMRHVLSRADGAVVQLTATSYGRGLYARLGFREVDTSDMFSGKLAVTAKGLSHLLIRQASPADLEPIVHLDRPVFGADRSPVLAELFSFAEEMLIAQRSVQVSEQEPNMPVIAGYAASWRNNDLLVIGPVVADDVDVATALITALAARSPSPIRLDIRGEHAALALWARANGLTAGGRTAVMVHGGDLPGDRSRLYAPVSVAIG